MLDIKTLELLLDEVKEGGFDMWAENYIEDAHPTKSKLKKEVFTIIALDSVKDFLESRIIEAEEEADEVAFLCDNTDHKGSEEQTEGVKEVVLTSTFSGEHCFWCANCRKRDAGMIEKIL